MSLKEYVQKMGLTNYKLSKMSKVSETTISQFFNKKRDVTFRTACKISDALGVTLDEFRKINNEE